MPSSIRAACALLAVSIASSALHDYEHDRPACVRSSDNRHSATAADLCSLCQRSQRLTTLEPPEPPPTCATRSDSAAEPSTRHRHRRGLPMTLSMMLRTCAPVPPPVFHLRQRHLTTAVATPQPPAPAPPPPALRPNSPLCACERFAVTAPPVPPPEARTTAAATKYVFDSCCT